MPTCSAQHPLDPQRPAAEPFDGPLDPTTGIALAGIGDEAGTGLDAQLAALERLGWRYLELRTVEGRAIADLDDAAFSRTTETLARRGVQVCCVDSGIGNWSRPVTGGFDADRWELEILAARCATLGAPAIRIMTYPNDGLSQREWRRRSLARVRALCSIAERRGVLLLAENCAGWAADRAERILDLLDTVASPALGLLFDTGNGIAHGYHAPALLADIADRVTHVHVKDARPSSSGPEAEPEYTVPGQGQAGVAQCLRLLVEHGYQGVWSIEPHLALRPHLGQQCGAGDADGFVAAGEALQRLAGELLAGAPHPVPTSETGAQR